MAKVLQAQGFASVSVGASSTQNYYIGQGGAVSSSSETVVTLIHRSPGVYSNAYVRVITNDRGVSTWTVRKNLANGNESVSIGASTTGEFQDSVNTDTVSAADTFNFRLSTGAGGTAFIISTAGISFAATTDTVERFSAQNSAATNTFPVIGGLSASSGTEANAQTKIKSAGTFKNFSLVVNTNTRDSNTTYRFRKNSANGNLIIVVGAAATGTFEDTANTDAVVVNDVVNYSCILDAGTGAIAARISGVDFVSTVGAWHFMSANSTVSITVASTVTTYFPIGGDLALNSTATEANVQTKSNVVFTATFLKCYISANTIVGASTLVLRKNAANGNQSVSITSLTTGYFEDAVNSDAVIATDGLNYALTGGGAGTSLTVRVIGMLAASAGSGSLGSTLLYMGVG